MFPREGFPHFSRKQAGRTYSFGGSWWMTWTPLTFSNPIPSSCTLTPHVLLPAAFALSFQHPLFSLSILPSTPVYFFSLPSRQLLLSPNALQWSFEGKHGREGNFRYRWNELLMDGLVRLGGSFSICLWHLRDLRFQKAHSSHSAIANLIFFPPWLTTRFIMFSAHINLLFCEFGNIWSCFPLCLSIWDL